jgi:hypothetical protein
MYVSACLSSLEDVRFCGYPQKRTWGNLRLAEISSYFLLESAACELRVGTSKYIQCAICLEDVRFCVF